MKIIWTPPTEKPEKDKKLIVKEKYLHTTTIFSAKFDGENFVQGLVTHDQEHIIGWVYDSDEVKK